MVNLRRWQFMPVSATRKCVGEKQGRMCLNKGLPIPRKFREDFKKINCRKININMFGQYFRFVSGLRLSEVTLPTKVHLVKAMVFPVVMYGCESWTINKAEHQRVDAFELWCWRRLLRIPWTERRSNHSILKESVLNIHWKGCCESWKSNTFGHLMWRTGPLEKPWCWERLKAGGEGDNRGWDGWMASPTRWTWVSVNSGSCWWTGRPGVLRSMGSQRVGHDWANWTKLVLNVEGLLG